jgi:hypothetical protein
LLIESGIVDIYFTKSLVNLDQSLWPTLDKTSANETFKLKTNGTSSLEHIYVPFNNATLYKTWLTGAGFTNDELNLITVWKAS